MDVAFAVEAKLVAKSPVKVSCENPDGYKMNITKLTMMDSQFISTHFITDSNGSKQ